MNTTRFSSADIDANSRARAIEFVWSTQLHMDIDLAAEGRPSFTMESYLLPNVMSISALSGSAAQMTRTPPQAAASGEELILCVAEHANVSVSKGRHDEVVYCAGDAHVWMANQGARVTVDRDYSAFMLSIPSSTFENRGMDLDRILEAGIPGSSSEMRLLSGYSTTLFREFGVVRSRTAEYAAAHLRDLALLALSSEQEKQHSDYGDSVRAARLARVKADINANLSSPKLCAGWIAEREGISSRYLRDLFALEHTHFTDYVLHQRLEHAYLLLTDPRQRHRTVSDIAYECGFGDLSYFNRRFKRQFDLTPSAIRFTTLV